MLDAGLPRADLLQQPFPNRTAFQECHFRSGLGGGSAGEGPKGPLHSPLITLWWHHPGWAWEKRRVCLQLGHFQSVTLVATHCSLQHAIRGHGRPLVSNGHGIKAQGWTPKAGVMEHLLTGLSPTLCPLNKQASTSAIQRKEEKISFHPFYFFNFFFIHFK